MLPVLFEGTVGGLPVGLPAYPVFLVLAAVVALALLARASAGLGVSRRPLLHWALAAVAAGLVGARALAVALNVDVYARDPWLAVEPAARGFALYGGALAGAVVMVAAAHRLRVGFGALADAGVVPFAAGLALVRVGCFLAGCCAGVETDLPWAISFPDAAPVGGLLGKLVPPEPGHVHPTQLYELVAVLAAALISGALARRTGLGDGGRAAMFATLFLGFRAAAQVLREPSPGAVLEPAAISAAYAVVAAAALVLAVGRIPRGPRCEVPAPA
jgi:phosphatidylglycerol:prolipoprotein diacylglycerol transferase